MLLDRKIIIPHNIRLMIIRKFLIGITTLIVLLTGSASVGSVYADKGSKDVTGSKNGSKGGYKDGSKNMDNSKGSKDGSKNMFSSKGSKNGSKDISGSKNFSSSKGSKA